MATEVINNFGHVAGWNSQQAVVLGRKLVGVTKIMYKDSTEVEAVYGAGRMPIGVGDGNYSAECGLTITEEELRGLLGSLPPGMRIQDMPPFDMPVLTIRNGAVAKDIVHNIKVRELAKEVNQNDKSISYDLTPFCTHITWNAQ